MIATNYLWWTNRMKNVPRVSQKESIVSTPADGSGRKMMLKPQYGSLACKIYLVSTFYNCNAGELVLDTCSNTSQTAKAYLNPSRSRRTAGD